MRIENPFHSGELEAQRLAGESHIAERNSVVIADSIIGGALSFLKQQRMVVFGTESDDHSRWASPLFGLPGFINPADARTLHFRRDQMKPVETDMFWRNLRPGARTGLLAIELDTRRRLRVNGVIEEVNEEGFAVAVREAFPNCPKYIQRRTLFWDDQASAETGSPATEGITLSAEVAQLLAATDTLFIASGHPDRGIDLSHRGGNPGFVHQVTADSFRVPDYAGNSLFNTFGNLLVDAKAGVTAIDFAGRRMLQMTGTANVEWKQPDEHDITGGTGRFWTFHVDRWRMLSMPGAPQWEFVDASPYNPGTTSGQGSP